MVHVEDIIDAHKRISSYIHYTPVVSNKYINSLSGAQIYFKCEQLQKVGAFKARGACNAVILAKEKEPYLRIVATHSSGNHAQALSWSARNLGIKAIVVMPSNAPQIKKNAVRDYGAEIVECEPTLEARESTLKAILEKTGAFEIHPYNNYNIIAGQATSAKELIEAYPNLDFILAPVGGGGLLSGTALSAHYFKSKAKVVGCEPEMADDALKSFKSGTFVPSVNPNTIADGLKTSLGDKTFPIILEHVHDIITVSEKEILGAMRMVWERMKMIIEPSSAVPLAVILKSPDRFSGKKVGVILSGGNVDLGAVSYWFK